METNDLGAGYRALLDSLRELEPVLDKEQRSALEARYQQEKPQLEQAVTHLLAFLVVLILVLVAVSSWLALRTMPLESSVKLALAVATGTLGSAVAALLSALDRKTHGWELSNGWKYQEPKPADKFQLSMLPLFWTRPLLGSVMGVVLYMYPWTDKLNGFTRISIGFWGSCSGIWRSHSSMS